MKLPWCFSQWLETSRVVSASFARTACISVEWCATLCLVRACLFSRPEIVCPLCFGCVLYDFDFTSLEWWFFLHVPHGFNLGRCWYVQVWFQDSHTNRPIDLAFIVDTFQKMPLFRTCQNQHMCTVWPCLLFVCCPDGVGWAKPGAGWRRRAW